MKLETILTVAYMCQQKMRSFLSFLQETLRVLLSIVTYNWQATVHTTGQCIWVNIPFIKDTPHLRFLFWTRTNHLVNNYISDGKSLLQVSFWRQQFNIFQKQDIRYDVPSVAKFRTCDKLFVQTQLLRH